MDMLEKVELVREKTGVSYQDAKEALEATSYDVLDAIIWLESHGKADTHTATYQTTQTDAASTASDEMRAAQEEYHKESKKTRVGEAVGGFWGQVKAVLRAGLEMTFIAERHGERVVTLPVLVVVIGLLAWGASLWLLIAGLFCGFKYRVEGAGPVTIDVNDAMNKASEAAESIKSDFTQDEE